MFIVLIIIPIVNKDVKFMFGKYSAKCYYLCRVCWFYAAIIDANFTVVTK